MSPVPTPAIALLVLDVDGVLTDGTVALMPDGAEVRSLHFHDLDAVTRARSAGVAVVVLTGEATPSVRRFVDRFGITDGEWGAKDKVAGIERLAARSGIPVERMCFVGDADRDASALARVGIGVAPRDATARARAAADHVVDVPGGGGVVHAVVELLVGLGAIPTDGEQEVVAR